MPVEFSYPVVGSPEVPASPSGDATAGAGGSRPYNTTTDGRSFLGFGLLVPFRRDGRGDFAAGSDVALVRASAEQVLGTECTHGTAAGELPWRPEFGSKLHLLRFRNVDDPVTRALAKQYVAEALARWEPRYRMREVRILRAKSSPGAADVDTLRVLVLGAVIHANVARNQVVAPDVPLTVDVR